MKKAYIIFAITALMLLNPAYAADRAPAADSRTAADSRAAMDSRTAAADDSISLNFIDIDISTITKSISEITGKNFIFDERLRGKITIIAPEGLTPEGAFNLFTSVLKLKGFTAVPAGPNTYKIIKSVHAKQHGMEVTTRRPPVNESYIVRLIALKHVDSNEAVSFLKPVVAADGHISAFEPGNLLLVVDSGLNIEKLLSIIKAIDRPLVSEEPELVLLKNANAEEAAAILNEGAARSAAKVLGKALAQKPRAVADQRLNAVVLFGARAQKDSMKRLLAILDTPSEEAQGGINVYFLENADAEELAKVLTGIVSGARKTAAIKSKAPFATSAKNIAITPDKATNSLVIVASQSDYQSLAKVIAQLDRRSRQVFVEAMIVEASIDKLRELGTKWRVIGTNKGEPVFIGGVGSIDANSISSIISGLTGLTMGGMGNFLNIPVLQADGTTANITVPGFAALFNLNEFRDAINILSTPQILTTDNTEAEIVVGENVPFISKMEADPARDSSVFNTIERKDVGITLRITPHITEGDYVKLDIYQEISALKETPAGVSAEAILTTVGPTTTKRSTKTTVIAKDKQTIVIGGLIQEKSEEIINKVPLLGDIPLLGWLFKSKGISKTRTNLIVFITPNIIRDDEELDLIAEKSRARFARETESYVKEELVVKFEEGVTFEEAKALIEEKGASVLRALDEPGTYLIRFKDGSSVKEAGREFSTMPGVIRAEPNYVFVTGDER